MLKRKLALMLGAVLCLCCAVPAAEAAEVDCDGVYQFSSGELSPEEELLGICVTALPRGKLMLGDRAVRPGDILTAEQVEAMTFIPRRSEQDAEATLEYLPVFADRVGPTAVMTFSIRGKENKAPAAEDFALETYKDLEVEGQLKVSDPEGEAMTFLLTRKPKRGDVELRSDGTFTYTPKKHKVGVDSFVYTATDASGKVSREATVTVTILKATDAPQYTDTASLDCRFEAEWMKNTGIFVGEMLDGNLCFGPEEPVTRGEFTAMLVKALDLLEADAPDYTGYSDQIPGWLRPYVAAAVRSGATAGLPDREDFGAHEPVTGAEAAVMLSNVLGLEAPVAAGEEEAVPAWAGDALAAMSGQGMALRAEEPLTRAEAAKILYRASRMATDRTRYLQLEQ